ncbi:hypothetical protein H0H92_002377, partial [Tricholoma furcatifolium]
PSTPFGYASGSAQSISNLKDKIKNVVWILLENRSFDNLLGGIKGRGFDNPINNGPFCNPQNDFDSVIDDPDHSVTGYNLGLYSTFSPDNAAIADGTLTPNLQGFVDKQLVSYPTLDPLVAGEQ